MVKKQQRENFETVIVKAKITATSNKSDGKYKQKAPTKTVYLVPESEAETKKLIDFGLTQYTPDNEKDKKAKPYFIVKATKLVKFYTSKDDYEEVYFGTHVEDVNSETGEITVKKSLNYTTTEPVFVAVMFVEGGDNGNDFYRLNSMMYKDRAVLQEVQPVNPFALLFEGDANPFA